MWFPFLSISHHSMSIVEVYFCLKLNSENRKSVFWQMIRIIYIFEAYILLSITVYIFFFNLKVTNRRRLVHIKETAIQIHNNDILIFITGQLKYVVPFQTKCLCHCCCTFSTQFIIIHVIRNLVPKWNYNDEPIDCKCMLFEIETFNNPIIARLSKSFQTLFCKCITLITWSALTGAII